jgi:hypothetical protein
MLQRVREDMLLIKLHKMLREEQQKPEQEWDVETIATIERLIFELAAQWKTRPKANNGRGRR